MDAIGVVISKEKKEKTSMLEESEGIEKKTMWVIMAKDLTTGIRISIISDEELEYMVGDHIEIKKVAAQTKITVDPGMEVGEVKHIEIEKPKKKASEEKR
jgi:hypothetical protein